MKLIASLSAFSVFVLSAFVAPIAGAQITFPMPPGYGKWVTGLEYTLSKPNSFSAPQFDTKGIPIDITSCDVRLELNVPTNATGYPPRPGVSRLVLDFSNVVEKRVANSRGAYFPVDQSFIHEISPLTLEQFKNSGLLSFEAYNELKATPKSFAFFTVNRTPASDSGFGKPPTYLDTSYRNIYFFKPAPTGASNLPPAFVHGSEGLVQVKNTFSSSLGFVGVLSKRCF